jgi:Zn-dependent protease
MTDPSQLIQQVAIFALPVIFAITMHEAAHGYAARHFGDSTAYMLGRISLNPIRHIDPVGTILLPIVSLALGGILFGWAKPVPVNFGQLRDRQLGMILVSAAGVTANMLLAFLALLLDRVLSPEPSGMLAVLLYYFAQINIILAAFNLIPIPPLDGSKILLGLAPPNLQNLLLRLEPFGFFIIIGLLYFGVLNPVIGFFKWMILSVIRLLLP